MTGVEWCALLTQHLCPQVNHPGNSGTHGQILSLRGYHKSLYRALNGLVKVVCVIKYGGYSVIAQSSSCLIPICHCIASHAQSLSCLINNN